MKTYRSIAWKELKAQRVTAILIFIAIIMSTVTTTVVGQSVGILQSMRAEQAAGLNGNRYASFHQLSQEQAEALRRDDRLFDVGEILTVGSMELNNSGLTLFLREYHHDALAMYPSLGKVKEGRLPENGEEIALPADVMQTLGLTAAVGDRISLTLSIARMDGSIPRYEYCADFTLTAVLESNYTGYATGTVDGIVGIGAAKRLLPKEYQLYSADFKTKSRTEFQSIVNELANELGIEEKNIQYNWVLLDAMGIAYDEAEGFSTDTGFSFMALACALVGALMLLAAGLVIYNVLKISVTKKIRQYGTLRAIGARRRQLYILISLQLLLLCSAGIPCGILLGLLCTKGVLIAATGFLNPQLFMVDSAQELSAAIEASRTADVLPLLASVAVTLAFAALASFPAARYASRVSPTVAMAGRVQPIRRRVRRYKPIRNVEAYYAGLNLKRSPGRTAITILSLVMSITVFVALQSFTGLLDTSSTVRDMHLGDYAVSSEGVGISAQAADALLRHQAVEHLSTVRLSVFLPEEGMAPLPFSTDLMLQSHESLQLAGIDEERLLAYADGLTENDKEELLAGTACLVKNPIPFSYGDMEVSFTQLATDDWITVGERSLRVAGIVDAPVTVNNEGFINGVQIITGDQVYCSLMNDDHFSEVYPALREGADADAFEDWLSQWCAKFPGTHYLSYRQSDAQMEESFAQIRTLCQALIFFIGTIGILNIINTVYSNIHTRVAEIGVQRAMGMSAESLCRTFFWEAAYYGMFASVGGGVLGYLCTVVISAAANDAMQLTAVPIAAIGQASAVSIAACLLATAVPLRGAKRRSIVESIRSVE